MANASSFFFSLLFIDVGVFEDRAVAMGKPHCNRSICTFRLWNIRFCYPVPELVEGSNLHRAFVTRPLSLSKGRTSTALSLSLRMQGSILGFPSVKFRVRPWYVSSLFFFFLFIDAGVFEDRAVAMGKPHCNRSICTFRLWNMRFCYPVPELVEGSALALRFSHPRECGDPFLVFLP